MSESEEGDWDEGEWGEKDWEPRNWDEKRDREWCLELAAGMRDNMAGYVQSDRTLIERAHDSITIGGQVCVTHVCDDDARELDAIRVEALTMGESEVQRLRVGVVLLNRTLNVLGKFFVVVDPPYTTIGSELVRREPIPQLMHLLAIAFVRGPSDISATPPKP